MSIDRTSEGTSPQYDDPAPIVYFGRRCELSRGPLVSLIQRDVEIAAVVIATPAPFGPFTRRLDTRSTLPLVGRSLATSPRTIDDVARDHGIPLFGVRRPLGIELADILAKINPALIVASCFPWRIPPKIASLAGLGTINLHPSPLPEFRGSDPLFWAFRHARSNWAVSVHRVTAALDAGPILGRKEVTIPDEIGGDQLESDVSAIGGALLATVVKDLLSGQAQECPQDERDASYQSFPTPEDLLVSTSWTVQRALNFIIGVTPLGYSPLIETQDGIVEIHGAARHSALEGHPRLLNGDNRRVVKFADGHLQLSLGERISEVKPAVGRRRRSRQ